MPTALLPAFVRRTRAISASASEIGFAVEARLATSATPARRPSPGRPPQSPRGAPPPLAGPWPTLPTCSRAPRGHRRRCSRPQRPRPPRYPRCPPSCTGLGPRRAGHRRPRHPARQSWTPYSAETAGSARCHRRPDGGPSGAQKTPRRMRMGGSSAARSQKARCHAIVAPT